MKIAILGFGTVGSGVYEIIENSASELLKDVSVEKVFARNKDKIDIATNNIEEIISDPNISVVVECLGGLDPAHDFIIKALENKKHVITANKAVVAKYMEEFLQVAKENNVKILFEASVGGGIPWLASLEKVRRIDTVDEIYGILNGTSNFILDDMYRFGNEFSDTLKEAQRLGYAEADPSADIDGYDVANKIIISSALAFDTLIKPDFPCFSMAKISKNDISYLKDNDWSVKYIGSSNTNEKNYETSVMLNIFSKESMEATTPSNFNIITLNGETIGELKFFGQGAGKLPTANAIVQDLLDIKTNNPRKNISTQSNLTYSDEMSKNKYLLRSENDFNNELIEISEFSYGSYYIHTKEITVKQLLELYSELAKNDSNLLVAMFRL